MVTQKKIPKTKKKYIQIFREIIKCKNNLEIIIDTDWITYHKERDTQVSEKFIKIFGKRRNYSDKLTQHHKNIAAAASKIEEMYSQLRYFKKI